MQCYLLYMSINIVISESTIIVHVLLSLYKNCYSAQYLLQVYVHVPILFPLILYSVLTKNELMYWTIVLNLL